MQYTINGQDDGSKVITVLIPGNGLVPIHSNHPNFDAIFKGVLENDESIYDLLDVAKSVATKFEQLTERISTAHGKLYLDGVEIENALATQAIRFIEEKVSDWKPLLAFYERVQNNPSEHSREQLHGWLARKAFTITDDGLIVGYKSVNRTGDKFLSIFSGEAIVDGEVINGRIPNRPGSVITMARDKVVHDPDSACSVGLHVATHGFAKNFTGDTIIEVHVDPRDVVSVPHEAEKMRVCRYKVIGTVEKPHETAVVWGDKPVYREYRDQLKSVSAPPVWPGKLSTPKPPAPMKKTQSGVTIGDKFKDLDPRKIDRVLTVVDFDNPDGFLVVVCEDANGKRTRINLDRLKNASRFQSLNIPKMVEGIKAGDRFEDLDPRRPRVVTVDDFEGHNAVVTSDSGRTSKIDVIRLGTASRFRKL